MNYDQEIEKMYHNENFTSPCPNCDGWEEHHDNDGRCLLLNDEVDNNFMEYVRETNNYLKNGLLTNAEANKLVARKFWWEFVASKHD